MSEYLGIFLDEADEQVDTLDDGLLRLEKEPENQELLQEIFRAAHSLKSSSAAMGFATMSRLTHAAEGILDGFRSGEMRPTTALIDLLLGAVDALKQMKEAVRAGEGDELDVGDVIARLQGKATGDVAAPEEGKGGERADLPEGEQPEDVRAQEDGISVSVRIAADCEMLSMRAYMVLRALDGIGKVVRTAPPREALEAGRFESAFRAVVAGSDGEEAIYNALKSISEVEEIRIEGDEPVEDVGPEGRGKSPAEVSAMARRGDQTVRVNVSRLDRLMNLVGELVIDRTRVAQLGADLAMRHGSGDLVDDLREAARHMGRIVGDLQDDVMKARMLPIAQLFRRFPRMVRDLAHKTDKEVELILEGEETELDRSVIEDMVDPLGHLLRNAVGHGVETPEERRRLGKPETARIILAARQEENHIVIEVTDDGAAMSRDEALQLVLVAGVSTTRAVNDVSGRGVGMDVVKSNVSRLRGNVHLRTKPGTGTTIAISLPLTLAISRALLLRSGTATLAVPLVYVVETARVPRTALRTIRGRLVTRFRGQALPLVQIRDALTGRDGRAELLGDLIRVVVVRGNGREAGLIVDELIGEQEVVLKPLGSLLGELPGLWGATILGNGTVALVVDVGSLMDHGGMIASLLTVDGDDGRRGSSAAQSAPSRADDVSEPEGLSNA
jgi:two-component system chemotaxis sensor kinase CheA